MPDLLTHVLIGYSIGTALSFRYDWLSPRLATIVMLGALVPDLTKIMLVLPSSQVEQLLGIPFEWRALHRLGGTFVVVAMGALLTDTEHRRHVFLLLALGAVSHHSLDALLIKPSGYSYAIFWPLTTYNPPTPNLFLSSDRWPAVAAGTIAAVLWYVRHYRYSES